MDSKRLTPIPSLTEVEETLIEQIAQALKIVDDEHERRQVPNVNDDYTNEMMWVSDTLVAARDEIERLEIILHDHTICPDCGWRKCNGECKEEEHVDTSRYADALIIEAAPDLFAEVKRLRDLVDFAIAAIDSNHCYMGEEAQADLLKHLRLSRDFGGRTEGSETED